MAIIKKSELKEMGSTQLQTKLKDLNSEMMKLRSQMSTKTTLESPGRVKLVRKTIAKIHTLLHQKSKVQEKKMETKEKKQSKVSDKKQKEVGKK